MLNTIYETGYDLHVANYIAYLHLSLIHISEPTRH